MKLVRIEGDKEYPVAEIKEGKVLFLHPTIQRAIDARDHISLPALKAYLDRFGSYTVHSSHEMWAEAVEIFLNFNVVNTAPKAFKWINEDYTEIH